MQRKTVRTSLSKTAGFTLVELLITTALATFLVLTITSLFMTFLLSNSSSNTKKTIREEGTAALRGMEFLLKNSLYLSSASCTTNMDSISLISIDRQETELTTITENSTTKIASNGAALTSSAVAVDNLHFDCSETNNQYRISIEFDLIKTVPTLSENKEITETFRSTVTLRNTR